MVNRMVVAAALAAAAVTGAATGLVIRPDGGSAAVAPVLAPASRPPAAASASATPTPSATPSARPTLKPTTTPTARPLPPRVRPTTAAPKPAPTIAPTTTAPAGPREGMAWVVLDNTSTVGANVAINAGSWQVPAGTRQTVEVKPEGAGHDAISVGDLQHAGCGKADSGWFFEAGKTFTLSITPSRDCYQNGQQVDSLTWTISPKVEPGG